GDAAKRWGRGGGRRRRPPVLGAIANQTVAVGTQLVITNRATDPDSPPQVLTFSLGNGAAANASIDPASGVFSWTPTAAQVGTNAFRVIVSDNGSPSLSATQTFSVVVRPPNNPPDPKGLGKRKSEEATQLGISKKSNDP